MKAFDNNLTIVQIIEIKGYDHFPSVAVFDINGKMNSLTYFDKLFESLKNKQLVYYSDSDFHLTQAYCYHEKFLTLQNGVLVRTDNFNDCIFYERSFFTSDTFRDVGIVPFINYSVLNAVGHGPSRGSSGAIYYR
jgi:hypothetical protein